MLELDDDCIRSICYEMDPITLLRTCVTCKKIKKAVFEEYFWKSYCYKIWTPEFWKEASKRPPKTAKCFVSFYHELQRLMTFENKLKFTPTLGYYKMIWKTLDKKI